MESGSAGSQLMRGIMRQIWLLLALFVILFATYIALGRQFVPALSNYRETLQAELSAQLGVDLRIGALEGQWLGYEPRVLLRDLRIYAADAEQASLVVGSLSVRLDILRSLRDRQPVFRRVRIQDTALALAEGTSGWSLQGMAPTGADSGGVSRPLLDWLLSQRDVRVVDVRLSVAPLQGDVLQLHFEDAALANSGSRHWFNGQARIVADAGSARLDIRVESRGDPFEFDDYLADLHLKVSELDIRRRIDFEAFELLQLQSLQGEAEIWAYLRNGGLDYVVGHLDLPRSRWTAGRDLQMAIESARTDFVANLDSDGGWVAELRGLRFRWRDQPSRISRLRLVHDPETQRLRLVSDRLALAPLNRFLLGMDVLGERLQSALGELSPSGELENIRLDWSLDESEPSRLLLEANLADVAVAAWKGAPAGNALRGYLRASEHGGFVDLDARNMGLGFPDLYTAGWEFSTLRGRVGWQIRDQDILVGSSVLQLVLQDTPIHARFGLKLNRDPEAGRPELDLRLGLQDATLALLPALLPDRLLADTTTKWLLGALPAGHVKRGAYLYRGVLGGGAERHKERSSLLYFDVDGVELAFHPDWPSLLDANALVLGNSDEIEVRLDSGRFMDAQLGATRAQLPLWGETSGQRLALRGQARVALAGARDILLQTPLRAHVPAEQLQSWRLAGDTVADIDLQIPLQADAELETRVGLDFDRAAIGIAAGQQSLDFSALSGRLAFDLETGLSAPRLDAVLWNKPVRASITGRRSAAGQQTTIRLRGRVAAGDLLAFTEQPVFTFLRGEAPFAARLDLYPDGRPPLLRVDSSLRGIAIDMPPPLAKSRNAALPLRFRLRLDTPQRMEFDLDERLFGRFSVSDGQLRRGRLQFGVADDSLPAQGIVIGGQVARLDLAEWLDFVPKLGARLGSASGEGAAGMLDAIELDIGRLDLFGYPLTKASARLQPAADGWRAELRNDLLDLLAALPSGDSPLDLHFRYLRLPSNEATGPARDPLAGVDPGLLPAIDLKVDAFSIGSEDYGSWQGKLRPQANGLGVAGIEGELRHLRIRDGRVDWTRQGTAHGTSVSLNVAGGNVAEVMQAWGYTPTLDSKKVEANFGLSWAGSPAMYSARTARGDIRLRLDRGQFYDIDPRASALRVFGVLNINTLARRLRLDFSDLFKKGLSYDEVRGSFLLHDGILSTQGSLSIEGPSTKMHISGDANLVTETLDQTMVVTLPVTSNLPLAALIAGQPAIAGAIWLTERLLGDRLERFASAQYRIRGDWNNPEVTLDRVFSDQQ